MCFVFWLYSNIISESVNCEKKHLLHWKEAPVNVIVLCVKLFQKCYLAHSARDFARLGNYAQEEATENDEVLK